MLPGGGAKLPAADETVMLQNARNDSCENGPASAQVLQPLFHLDPAYFAGTTVLTIWAVDFQEGQHVADPASHPSMPHRDRASVSDVAHVSTCRDHIVRSVKK